jgi:hypothetical protein
VPRRQVAEVHIDGAGRADPIVRTHAREVRHSRGRAVFIDTSAAIQAWIDSTVVVAKLAARSIKLRRAGAGVILLGAIDTEAKRTRIRRRARSDLGARVTRVRRSARADLRGVVVGPDAGAVVGADFCAGSRCGLCKCTGRREDEDESHKGKNAKKTPKLHGASSDSLFICEPRAADTHKLRSQFCTVTLRGYTTKVSIAFRVITWHASFRDVRRCARTKRTQSLFPNARPRPGHCRRPIRGAYTTTAPGRHPERRSHW